MTVAVQKGLENLAAALRTYGFDIVEYENYPYSIDALVYTKAGTLQSMSVSYDAYEPHGVFMVNAYGKSADDIAAILSRRTYTPLL